MSAAFKVGDRVRVIDPSGDYRAVMDALGTVVDAEDDGAYLRVHQDEHGRTEMFAWRFEHAAEPVRFEVGERVRIAPGTTSYYGSDVEDDEGVIALASFPVAGHELVSADGTQRYIVRSALSRIEAEPEVEVEPDEELFEVLVVIDPYTERTIEHVTKASVTEDGTLVLSRGEKTRATFRAGGWLGWIVQQDAA